MEKEGRREKEGGEGGGGEEGSRLARRSRAEDGPQPPSRALRPRGEGGGDDSQAADVGEHARARTLVRAHLGELPLVRACARSKRGLQRRRALRGVRALGARLGNVLRSAQRARGAATRRGARA